jgi:two-component system response regulator
MTARRLVLVEDNPDDEELAVLALKRADVDCVIDVAHDGEEAVALLFDGAGPPSLVLLDLKVPKLDGFQILERIRQHPTTRTVPVVILSSSDVREDIVRAYELGANAYVKKPVEFTRYTEVVNCLGKFWLDLNEDR